MYQILLKNVFFNKHYHNLYIFILINELSATTTIAYIRLRSLLALQFEAKIHLF